MMTRIEPRELRDVFGVKVCLSMSTIRWIIVKYDREEHGRKSYEPAVWIVLNLNLVE